MLIAWLTGGASALPQSNGRVDLIQFPTYLSAVITTYKIRAYDKQNTGNNGNFKW